MSDTDFVLLLYPFGENTRAGVLGTNSCWCTRCQLVPMYSVPTRAGKLGTNSYRCTRYQLVPVYSVPTRAGVLGTNS